MKSPVWTHPLFAAFVALLFVVAAAGAMKVAVLYAQLKVDPLARIQHDTTRAILLLVLSMLLVIGSLVVPLVVRRKAQRRLERDNGVKA
jgi:hypothetical protein